MPAQIIDLKEWKAKRAHEEFMSWARRVAMDLDLDIDFEDPDFWDEVEYAIKEEFND